MRVDAEKDGVARLSTGESINSSITPGCAIVTGTQQGIYANVSRADYFSVSSAIAGIKDSSFKCDMNLEALSTAAHQGGYFSYVAGVASYMCEWYNVGGASIEITRMDVDLNDLQSN